MRNLTGLFLLGMCLAAPVAAAEPVTLLETYQSAIARNPEIRGEQTYVQAERSRVDEAWAGVKPQVDFTAGYGRTEYTRDVGLAGIQEGSDEPRRLDVSLSQVVYSREAFKSIDRAVRSVDKTEAQFEATRSRVGTEALHTYLEVRRIQRLEAVLEEEMASHHQRAEQLDEMLKRGFATRAELLEARSRVDEVRAELVGLTNDERVALQTLRRLTGLPVQQLARLNESLWQHTPSFVNQDWEELVLANAPSLQLARAEARLANSAYEVAKSGHYPELFLKARYTDNDSFATSLLEEKRIELQLVVPLYKGGATSARTRAARYREEGAEWLLASELETIRVEVERLTSELTGTYNTIQALDQAVASARASENAAREGFEAGVRDLTGLLDVRKRRSDIEQQLISTIYENLAARIELLALAGRLNEQHLATWVSAGIN